MTKLDRIQRKLTRIFFYIINKKKFSYLGKNSYIEKPLFINNSRNISIGRNVLIRDNARIEAIKEWNSTIFNSQIEIGDRTSIEQDLHMIAANLVRIGSDCVLSARVFISDLDHAYENINVTVMKQELKVKDIYIGDGCFIGYGVCILAGVHLGKHCIVGANSVVTKSFSDYSVIVGNPAYCIKKYDETLGKWTRVPKE